MRCALAIAASCLCLSIPSGVSALSDDAALIVGQIVRSGDLDKFCAGDQQIRKQVLGDAAEKIKNSLHTSREKQRFGGFAYKSKPEASAHLREHRC